MGWTEFDAHFTDFPLFGGGPKVILLDAVTPVTRIKPRRFKVDSSCGRRPSGRRAWSYIAVRNDAVTYFSILLVLLVGLLLAEYLRHRRHRRRIPIRIHVNGIRGKSSVTRLVAAGLREGGLKTWAKVTGTRPNIIDERGRDLPVRRFAGPRLSEQRTVVREAAERGVEALVLECMALQPINQQVSEDGIVRATIGVMTNIRHDHLEVFGPSLDSIARALAATVPRKGVLVMSPGPGVDLLRAQAVSRGTRVLIAEERTVGEESLRMLPYPEHGENLAIALRVCEEVGVPRAVALRGMRKVRPDPGALDVFDAQRGFRTLHVVCALAANDPDSTEVIFRERVVGRWDCPLLVLVNTRRDRPLRSLQLGTLLARLPAARFFLYGDDAGAVRLAALQEGLPVDAFVSCHGLGPKELVERLFASVTDEAVLFAIGNTGGNGLALMQELHGSSVQDD